MCSGSNVFYCVNTPICTTQEENGECTIILFATTVTEFQQSRVSFLKVVPMDLMKRGIECAMNISYRRF